MSILLNLNMTNNVLDSMNSPCPEGQESTAITIHPKDNKDRDRRLHHLEVKREKLRALYPQTLENRALVAERRSELAELRLVISSADDRFMKFVREQLANASLLDNNAQLEELSQELQTARDKYGVLEDEYNALENRLNRQEYHLNQLQEYVFKHSSTLQNGAPCDTDDVDSLSESDGAEEGVFEVSFHSLEDEFLSRFGDADLCKEARDQLVYERNRLLKIKEQRLRVGNSLSPEDEAILEDFPSKEEKILAELAIIEEDVDRLRDACIEQGLLQGWEDETDILESSDGSVDIEQAEYNKFPLLLHRPRDDEKKFQSLISDFEEDNPGNRITRWLLHKLKSSCSEVEFYARVSSDMGSRSDNMIWQEDVLRHWYRDSANKPPSAFAVDHTMTIIAPSPRSDNRTALQKSVHSLPIQLLQNRSNLYEPPGTGESKRATRQSARSL
jgi:hypothetical protein